MLKSELIKSIASKQTQFSHADVNAIVNGIVERMINELANGGRMEIRGFGTFSLRYRAPKIGHNPITGEKISVEQKYSVHFKPALNLRKRVDYSSKKYPIL